MEKAAACWVFLLNNEVRDLAANNFCILATKFLLFNKKRRKHKLWKVGKFGRRYEFGFGWSYRIELFSFRVAMRQSSALNTPKLHATLPIKNAKTISFDNVDDVEC